MFDPRVITTAQQLPLDVWEAKFAELPESWRNYILATFVPSLARNWARKSSDADWVRARRRALAILESPTTSVVVSCAQGVEGPAERLIIGWLVHTQNVLQFVYVRTGYRGAGVGLAMLNLAITTPSVPCTHWNKKLPDNGWTIYHDRMFFYCGVDRIRGHNVEISEREVR